MSPVGVLHKAIAEESDGERWSAEGLRPLRAEVISSGLCSAEAFRTVSGNLDSRGCSELLLSVVSPFVLIIVGMFCWVFYHVFGVFIHAVCWVFIPYLGVLIHVFGFPFCTLGLLIP